MPGRGPRRGAPAPPLPAGALAARAHRAAALADFDIVASELHRLRRLVEADPRLVDPTELVAAEARAEAARGRFWAADQTYQAWLNAMAVG